MKTKLQQQSYHLRRTATHRGAATKPLDEARDQLPTRRSPANRPRRADKRVCGLRPKIPTSRLVQRRPAHRRRLNTSSPIGYGRIGERRRWLWLALGLLSAALVGCSKSSTVNPTRESAEFRYERGIAACYAGRWEEAWKDLDQVLHQSGLDGDQTAEVLCARAIIQTARHNFDAAHQELDVACQGAPAPEIVWATRAYVYGRQQRTAAAESAWQQARRLNPRVPSVAQRFQVPTKKSGASRQGAEIKP